MKKKGTKDDPLKIIRLKKKNNKKSLV